jgi:hypothetical protein
MSDNTLGILSGNMDDQGHYCKMAAAIDRTMQVQQQINELYLLAEKEVITFN